MKSEYAINFSEYEVRAALEGRKAQARRIVKPVQSTPRIPPLTMTAWLFDGVQEEDEDGRPYWTGLHPEYPTTRKWFTCPFGKVGTRLWARETWQPVMTTAYRCSEGIQQATNPNDASEAAVYKVGWDRSRPGLWRSSTQMPRWASRLTFEIVNVRIERVQDITEQDILAEGVTVDRIAKWCKVPWSDMPTLHHAYRVYWDHINGNGAWERGNWVWVLELKRVEEKN